MPAAARVPQEALDREFDLVHRVCWLLSPLRQPYLVCRSCQPALLSLNVHLRDALPFFQAY
jgi:hypothetical protein